MNALYRTMSVRMSLLDFFTQYMYNQEPAELSVETASAARSHAPTAWVSLIWANARSLPRWLAYRPSTQWARTLYGFTFIFRDGHIVLAEPLLHLYNIYIDTRKFLEWCKTKSSRAYLWGWWEFWSQWLQACRNSQYACQCLKRSFIIVSVHKWVHSYLTRSTVFVPDG